MTSVETGRPQAGQPIAGHLVVGTDGSREANGAVVWAAREAEVRGAVLSVVHVTPTQSMRPTGQMSEDRRTAEAELSESVRRARVVWRGDVRRLLAIGDPVDTLLGLALDADLLVVGARGLSAAASKIVGSTSLALATSAPCPVIVVRPAHANPRRLAPSRGRIVVGVDGTGEVRADVRVRFRRGRPARLGSHGPPHVRTADSCARRQLGLVRRAPRGNGGAHPDCQRVERRVRPRGCDRANVLRRP